MAKEAVNCLFYGETNPEEVMRTLEAKFGRTDALIITEVEKLRALPKLTDSARDTCVAATKVNNIVATMKALNKENYLNNRAAIRIVLEKLTPSLLYRWYDYITTQQEDSAELPHMAEFLNREAERCGRYTAPEDLHARLSGTSETKTRRIQRAHATHHHETLSTAYKAKTCLICNGDHPMSACATFKEATLPRDTPSNAAQQRAIAHESERLTDTRIELPSGRDVNTSLQTKGALKNCSDTPDRPITLIDAAVAEAVGAAGTPEPFHIEGVVGTAVDASASQRVTLEIPGRHHKKTHHISAHTMDRLNLFTQTSVAVENRNQLRPTLNSVGYFMVAELDKRIKCTAQDILRARTRQNDEGRYETGLLWRNNEVRLPHNYEAALSRLIKLEKRLDQNETLKKAYEAQMVHTIKSGYAEIAADLPREVASGRAYEVPTTPRIAEEDRDALRFLWRSDRREGQPTEYRITRVIFGAASSPCTAIYVKNANAEKHRESFSAAATGIVQNHYMDDYLQSFPTTQEAIEIARKVALIHSRAHFTLQKWRSNDEPTLNALTPEPRQVDKKLNCGTNEEKVLGLIWRPKSDTLAFDLDLKRVPKEIMLGQKRLTKREILKTAMSVFDPLGLAASLTIAAKRILQATWKLGTDWDEEVPDAVYKDWNTWLEHLQASGPRHS
ncbi:hypothetical protein EVAR_96587_1 [Eumeta japonica]|uniref:Uncharacterized protein n=1 Tax=Eumeta variegata TaxID=151549 RepID=A0A4C1WUK9_EUMVA|nr:hypothetical protein EVAR_96587_1 [Eumeta japonica]